MRRLGLVIVLLLLVAACGQPTATDDAPTPEPEPTATETQTGTAGPDPTPAETEPDPEAPAGESTAFFVRSHESGPWVERQTVPLETPTLGVARAAMEHLVRGPVGDPGLGTEVPAGTTVLDVNISDRVLIVDLSQEVADASGASAQEGAFAQQLAHTAAQFDTVDAVRLLIEGQEVTDLWGHFDWSEPLAPDPFALSPITFDSHEWGEQVAAGSVTVGGEANTFEATVELRLVGPDEQVREDTFTTATSGTGERGTWSHTFTMDEPGRWTVVAVEPDPSGGEGRPPFETELELEVG